MVLIHEWEQLEQVIGRQESFRVEIRKWGGAIFGVLIASISGTTPALGGLPRSDNYSLQDLLSSPWRNVLLGGLLYLILFYLVERVYMIAQSTAIKRKRELDRLLRDPMSRLIEYDGPCIGDRIKESYKLTNVISTIFLAGFPHTLRFIQRTLQLQVIYLCLNAARLVIACVRATLSAIASSYYRRQALRGVWGALQDWVSRKENTYNKAGKSSVRTRLDRFRDSRARFYLNVTENETLTRVVSFYAAILIIFVFAWRTYPSYALQQAPPAPRTVACACEGEPRGTCGVCSGLDASARFDLESLHAKLDTSLLAIDRSSRNVEALAKNSLRLFHFDTSDRQPWLGNIDLSNCRIDLGNIGLLNVAWDVVVERLVLGLDVTYRRDLVQNDQSFNIQLTQFFKQDQRLAVVAGIIQKSLHTAFWRLNQLQVAVDALLLKLEEHRHEPQPTPRCGAGCPKCKGFGCHKLRRK
ncbi:MAG: hypothetical protein AAGA92_02515 [Planctomycetota bacterium]